jgi:hypothetical protein
VEKFSLKKLYEVYDKKRYRVEVANRFAALEDLNTEVKIILLEKRLERI